MPYPIEMTHELEAVLAIKQYDERGTTRTRPDRELLGREFLHQDLFEMAAALLVSLVGNHPFVDGNKRTGLAAMLTVLELNEYSVDESHALVDITLAVASGSMSKAQVCAAIARLRGKIRLSGG